MECFGISQSMSPGAIDTIPWDKVTLLDSEGCDLIEDGRKEYICNLNNLYNIFEEPANQASQDLDRCDCVMDESRDESWKAHCLNLRILTVL